MTAGTMSKEELSRTSGRGGGVIYPPSNGRLLNDVVPLVAEDIRKGHNEDDILTALIAAGWTSDKDNRRVNDFILTSARNAAQPERVAAELKAAAEERERAEREAALRREIARQQEFERQEAKRLAAQQLEAEQHELERQATERRAVEQREREQRNAERRAIEQQAAAQRAADAVAQQREYDRMTAEQREAAKREQERLAAERLIAERLENSIISSLHVNPTAETVFGTGDLRRLSSVQLEAIKTVMSDAPSKGVRPEAKRVFAEYVGMSDIILPYMEEVYFTYTEPKFPEVARMFASLGVPLTVRPCVSSESIEDTTSGMSGRLVVNVPASGTPEGRAAALAINSMLDVEGVNGELFSQHNIKAVMTLVLLFDYVVTKPRRKLGLRMGPSWTDKKAQAQWGENPERFLYEKYGLLDLLGQE